MEVAMMGLQEALMEPTLAPMNRVAMVKQFFADNKCQFKVNPDTGNEIAIYPARDMQHIRSFWKQKMFNNPEFDKTGYMAVNASGRCGWKLLPMACFLEDENLIKYLLDQGANGDIGNERFDLEQAIRFLQKDRDAVDDTKVQRTLQVVRDYPKLPNFKWLAEM
jgi:hypothetical protein